MNEPSAEKQIGFVEALQATWPVMVGYLPMALAFGLIYGDIWLSFLSGLWVFAGASQFLSLKLFQNHSSLVEIWLSVFFLNIRHVFYSLHYLSRYQHFPLAAKVYSIFSLTDETYAVLANHQGKTTVQDARLVWRISFLNHATWFLGCILGAFLKALIVLEIKGLDFFLVALFVILLVEQIKKDRNYKALAVAGVVGTLALYSNSSLWLFWAMGSCVCLSFFLFRNPEEAS